MKTILIIFIVWMVLFAPFAWYFAANHIRSTRIDRMQDRKAKEARRAELDRLEQMRIRNATFKRLRK